MLNVWDSKLHDGDLYLIDRTGKKRSLVAYHPIWPWDIMFHHVLATVREILCNINWVLCAALAHSEIPSSFSFNFFVFLMARIPFFQNTPSAVHLRLFFLPIFPVLVLTQARTLNMWNIIINKGSSPTLSKFKRDPSASFK